MLQWWIWSEAMYPRVPRSKTITLPRSEWTGCWTTFLVRNEIIILQFYSTWNRSENHLLEPILIFFLCIWENKKLGFTWCLWAFGFERLHCGIAFEVQKYFNLNANSFSPSWKSPLLFCRVGTSDDHWAQQHIPRHTLTIILTAIKQFKTISHLKVRKSTSSTGQKLSLTDMFFSWGLTIVEKNCWVVQTPTETLFEAKSAHTVMPFNWFQIGLGLTVCESVLDQNSAF